MSFCARSYGLRRKPWDEPAGNTQADGAGNPDLNPTDPDPLRTSEQKGAASVRYYGLGVNLLAVARRIQDWRESRKLEREKELRLREWRKRD